MLCFIVQLSNFSQRGTVSNSFNSIYLSI